MAATVLAAFRRVAVTAPSLTPLPGTWTRW